MKTNLRVLNLAAGGDGKGEAVDVWSGTEPGHGGVKVATVPYGERSDVITPLVSKSSQPQTQDGKTFDHYVLWVTPVGSTDASSPDGTQLNGESYPGDEVTVLVTEPAASSGSARRLGAMAIFTKLGGERPGYETPFAKIDVPAGKRAVAVDAHAVTTPPYDPANPATISFGLASGPNCLSEVGEQVGPNSTLWVSTGTVFGFAFVADAATTSVDVARIPDGVFTGSPCAKTVGTADLPAALGDKVVLILYGDPDHPSSVALAG